MGGRGTSTVKLRAGNGWLVMPGSRCLSGTAVEA